MSISTLRLWPIIQGYLWYLIIKQFSVTWYSFAFDLPHCLLVIPRPVFSDFPGQSPDAMKALSHGLGYYTVRLFKQYHQIYAVLHCSYEWYLQEKRSRKYVHLKFSALGSPQYSSRVSPCPSPFILPQKNDQHDQQIWPSTIAWSWYSEIENAHQNINPLDSFMNYSCWAMEAIDFSDENSYVVQGQTSPPCDRAAQAAGLLISP